MQTLNVIVDALSQISTNLNEKLIDLARITQDTIQSLITLIVR